MEFTEEIVCYISELFKPLTFSFIGIKALDSTLELKVVISDMPGNFRRRLLLVFIFSFHAGLFPKDLPFESTVTCCHEAEWQDFHFSLKLAHSTLGASQVALVGKKLPNNAGDIRDTASIPGLGRSPGGGHGNPFQYLCLENHCGQRLVGYGP